MEPFRLKNELFFAVHDWMEKDNGLVAGFTTKNGGLSTKPYSSLNLGFHVHDREEAVLHNRRLLAKSIQFPINHWVGSQQTHDINIMKVTKEHRGNGSVTYDHAFKQIDGFFTTEKGILLTLCFADCVPLFFYARRQKAIGIAHAGWKGSVHGIAEKMIHLFKQHHISPKEIFIVIGPSICEKCYIVDNTVIEKVNKSLESVGKFPYNQINGKEFSLNLKELNRLILLKEGVPSSHILVTQYCTSCHQEYFFSHRRDKGTTGRMMGFIGWKEETQD